MKSYVFQLVVLYSIAIGYDIVLSALEDVSKH